MAAERVRSTETSKVGLVTARRIESTVAVIRSARAHAKRAAPSSAAVRARKQLKKLRVVLEETQRKVIQDGITVRGAEHLLTQLEAIEGTLATFLEERATKAVLKLLAAHIKEHRGSLKR